MRNLWALLREFDTLPTDDRFLKLTDLQIDLLLYSMEEDARELKRARDGVQGEGDHYDSSFDDEVWDKPVGDWDVLKEGHNADEIARQVEALTKEEDRKNLEGRFDGLDEYNDHLEAGGMTTRESEVTQYINRQLEEAERRARDLSSGTGTKKRLVDDRELAGESKGEDYALNKQAMDKAISLFNEDDDDEYTAL